MGNTGLLTFRSIKPYLTSHQYLGRAKDAAEFVKHGCREASIEIELQGRANNRTGRTNNPIITRTIKREGNKSTYTLNGTVATGKDVQIFARSFDIQIDNLCQFLPQDKVVEFAQMSPIELLNSTQRAAAPPELLEMHENLKKIRAAQKEALGGNRGDRERLENLENRQEMQRTEVERMRERAAVKQKLEWLEKCRPIAQYTNAKRKAREAKEKQKELAAELKQLKNESGPTLHRVNAKQLYERQIRDAKDAAKKELTAGETACDRVQREIEGHQEKIDEYTNIVDAEERSVKPKREDLHRIQRKIASLKVQKEQQPERFDSRGMNEKIQEFVGKRRELDGSVKDLEDEKALLRTQGRERKQAIEGLKKQLEGLETQKGQQASKLETISRDTFRAWKWIENNRDQFKKHVFGPPIVECSIEDSRMATAVESLLQRSDFKIITVQDREDFALLQQKLIKEQKLHDISLRTCTEENLNHFRPPVSEEERTRYGLQSWAIDHLKGPATVLAMLCIEKGLHQCGIAVRDINQQQHDALADSNVRGYVAGKKCYQFSRRAEYGSAGSTARARDTRPAQIWTDQPVDQGRKSEIEREILAAKGEYDLTVTEFKKLDAEMKKLENEQENLTSEINKMRREKDEKQKALTEWQALGTKIRQAEEREQALRQDLDSVKDRQADMIAKKDEELLSKAEAVLRYAGSTKRLKDLIEKALEIEVLHIEALSDFEVMKSRNEHIVKMLEEKGKEEKEASAASKEEIAKAKDLYKTCQDIRDESEALREQGENGFSEILQDMARPDLTEDDLDADIDAQKARLELTEGGNVNMIKEFEDRAKTIARLRSRVTEFDQKQQDLKQAIHEVRAKWEPELDVLVSKISDAFSDSFERIGCAGQVVVYKASSQDPEDCTEENGGSENGLDFSNWAIHISVKFRDNESLTLLDSHRQSGGERAVSTIFYLMALQSLSRAPFRVVDEINQGMDPRNERMVHGRLVDIAADNEGGSQYFLITPKLLSGLKYRRGMTVLCIVSGENMPTARRRDDQGKWVDGAKVDFAKFIKIARDLKLNDHGRTGRRIDSGVSFARRSETVDHDVGGVESFSSVAEVGA